ncbi:MAG: 30S ribosome-binding factor RbfA [Aeromicrobium sp.]|uniref:30S ribosome-binding factor RbfA n=1 Tax=Aeromicrobium sp. TaxID=1871063 RepID=UPI0039E42DD2
MAGQRQNQIADRIKVIVAELVERRLKDPRLGFVTITDVRVTGDHQHASVFYTVLGDADAIEGSGAALRSATGMLRSEVGKRLGLRHTPSLEFFLDAVPESARHIEDLLAQAKASDAEVAAQAEGARYAGEADPYKHHDEEQ